VGGEVVFVHKSLEAGADLPGQTVVVRITEEDLKVRLENDAALVAQVTADRLQLRTQKTFLSERIALAERMMALETADLARVEQLLVRDIGTERDLDAVKRQLVRSQDTLAALRMTQAELTPRIASADARLRQANAALAATQLDVKRTTIKLPFPATIASASVEEHQVVKPGQILFRAWDVAKVEVPVVLTLEEALLLDPSLGRGQGNADVTATVTFSGEAAWSWPGQLLRFEPVDADTQTIRAVIKVENPKHGAPLLPGMFCRVELQAARTIRALMIPADAVQERGRVFLVRDGRLALATIERGPRVGAFVTVRSGLEDGDQVVISPLERTVEGIELEVLEEASPIAPEAGPNHEAADRADTDRAETDGEGRSL
jgi:RND family efflux transporter MFP subunit